MKQQFKFQGNYLDEDKMFEEVREWFSRPHYITMNELIEVFVVNLKDNLKKPFIQERAEIAYEFGEALIAVCKRIKEVKNETN